jgi:hypothetical protein
MLSFLGQFGLIGSAAPPATNRSATAVHLGSTHGATAGVSVG